MLSEIEEYIGFSIPVSTPPSKEEVQQAAFAFNEKINERPEVKKIKASH